MWVKLLNIHLNQENPPRKHRYISNFIVELESFRRIRFQGYRLHWLTQTFARPVANVCNRGCKRLREKASFYHQASALQIDASGGTGYSAAREVIDGFSRRCLLMVLWCMDGIGERVGIGILQAINCAKASVGQRIGIEEEGLIPCLSAVSDTLVQAIAERSVGLFLFGYRNSIGRNLRLPVR